MRIKRVTIDAFASYDRLEMSEEFNPGCNLILGKNGCGKSNFLQGKPNLWQNSKF
jgi:chromosome segregation ATPase